MPERPEWLTPAYPELREGPPWVMSEMILSERELPAAILWDASAIPVAAAVRAAVAARQGVVVTGCGTSEHAARAVALLIAQSLGADGGRTAVVARQAFEAALEPEHRGLCVGISHGGTSAATVKALLAARQAACTTCLITAAESSEAHLVSDLVFRTPLTDVSWCHTVGYLSPVLAGAAIAGAIGGRPPDGGALETLIAECDSVLAGSSTDAARLAACDRLLVVGSGADAITACEQTLKIEEGAWIPAAARHVETLLHGHLPAADGDVGLIGFLLDPRERAQRATRLLQALRAARAVGVMSLLVTDSDYGPELRDESSADFVVVLPSSAPAGVVGALTTGAIALQRLTLALSESRGTNPDLLRRDNERYRTAALLGQHKLRMFAPPP